MEYWNGGVEFQRLIVIVILIVIENNRGERRFLLRPLGLRRDREGANEELRMRNEEWDAECLMLDAGREDDSRKAREGRGGKRGGAGGAKDEG